MNYEAAIMILNVSIVVILIGSPIGAFFALRSIIWSTQELRRLRDEEKGKGRQ